MAEDWLVLLNSPIPRRTLEQLGEITWIAPTTRALTIRIAPERVRELRRLPGVRRLEPPVAPPPPRTQGDQRCRP